jgi:ELWxxDGT repeat protein
MKKLAFLLLAFLTLENVFSQVLVKNLAPGLSDGDPQYFYRFNTNSIVFFASDGLLQFNGLYITDGTTSGTIKLKGFNTAIYSVSSPQYLNEINVADAYGFTKIDSLGYIIRRNTTTAELTRTNGSVSGTKSFTFSVPSSTMQPLQCLTRFFKLGNNICWIYKTTNVGPIGYFLYKYNVITNTISSASLPNHFLSYISNYDNGIVLHRSLHNSYNGVVTYPGPFNRTYTIEDVLTSGNYFYVYKKGWTGYKDSLFRIDATGARLTVATTTYNVISNFGVLLNGKYLFPGNDPALGVEPYCFNTVNNTLGLLKDINPYLNYPSNPSFIMLPFDKNGYNHSKIYLLANHADYGSEMWITDGTTSGTQMVQDFKPGPTSSNLYSTGNYIKTNYLGDSLITSSTLDDSLRLVTSNAITTFSVKAPYNPNGITGAYVWRKGNSLYLLDQLGFVYKQGFSQNPIDTLDKLNCNSGSFPILANAMMEINGCIILNQKDCAFTGYELYKYCNNSIISGIEQNTFYDKVINVYPNPSNGHFTFEGLPENCSIEVTDLTGRVIHTQQLSESGNTINLHDKQQGVYLYKLSTKENKLQQGKLLLE